MMDRNLKESKYRIFNFNLLWGSDRILLSFSFDLEVNEMKQFLKDFALKALNSAKDGLMQGVTEGIKEAVKENVKAPVKKGVNALFTLPKQFLS